jgi:hypothetical protein
MDLILDRGDSERGQGDRRLRGGLFIAVVAGEQRDPCENEDHEKSWKMHGISSLRDLIAEALFPRKLMLELE